MALITPGSENIPEPTVENTKQYLQELSTAVQRYERNGRPDLAASAHEEINRELGRLQDLQG